MAQAPGFNVLKIGEKEALPDAQIINGLQCSRGFIWIVSNQTGLSRFDGNRVKLYNEKKYGLDKNIKYVLEAPDSLIWAVSKLLGEKEKRISIFDPISERAISFEAYFKNLPLKSNNIKKIQKNDDGNIWLITFDNKIYEYNGRSFILWGVHKSQNFKSLYKLNDSSYYEISYHNVSTVNLYSRNAELKQQHLLSFASELNFVGSSNHNSIFIECISKSDQHTINVLTKITAGQEAENIDSARRENFKTYYIKKHILYKVCPSVIYCYKVDNLSLIDSLKTEQSTNFQFIDNQNGVWASKNRGQLFRYHRSKSLFKNYQYPIRNVIWHTAARGISKGINNDIFIAQGGMLVHISKDEKVNFLPTPEQEKKLPDYFGMMLQRDKSAIWLADGNKIWNIDPLTLKFRNYLEHSKPGLFWQPYEDKNGRIWLGSSEGLFYIDSKKSLIKEFENYSDFNSLKNTSVFSFYENSSGLWLCSSKGLFLLNEKYEILKQYHSNGKGITFIPHDVIVHLHEDENGWFWLASKGGGLIRWNSKTGEYKQFNSENNQFLDNTIYAVYPDNLGRLWLPSNKGLMSFDKKTHEIIYYLEEDGLPDLEFNTISHYKAEDGSLFFGGVKGAISFYPEKINIDKTKPSIIITGFKKINYNDEEYFENFQFIQKEKPIKLYPHDKSFEFSFAYLDLNSLKNQRYSYKIEGYDKIWQSLESPLIKINNLPYGKYRLLLRAQAPGIPWQEFEFPILIQVIRPFYLQWWFVLIALIGLIVVILNLIRRRFAHLRKRKDELEAIVVERTSEIAQQAEELKNLDNLKSRFFANISHELRTPLTLILGQTENMQETPKGMLDEKTVRNNLKKIKKNSTNLINLIDEIMELSKLESGNIELRTSPTEIFPFVEKIFRNFESLAVQKRIKYDISYNLTENLCLLIDREKFEKIINNLIFNAFKFTGPEKEISLNLWESESELNILVKDQGIGISEKDLPHIFNRFYQSKLPNISAQGGAGIGLSLCKEFANLMGGSIEVKSELGKGSRFLVKIPKIYTLLNSKDDSFNEEELMPELSSKIIPSSDSQTKYNILLVEDNRDMQDFINSILSQNYNILMTNNGIEALEILGDEKNKIDLVITDVMMPIMDGMTLIKRIKEHETMRSLPIVMLTALSDEANKLESLIIGVDDYITKPFSVKELRVRVNNIINNIESRKKWNEYIDEKTEIIIQNNPLREDPDEKIDENEENFISQQDLSWIKDVEKLVREYMADENFDIEILSKKMLLSKRQFERKIKKITGLTPAKLVLEIRLQTALEYMEQGLYNTISEVSYAIGIQSPGYFSQIFYKRFGKKASEYFK